MTFIAFTNSQKLSFSVLQSSFNTSPCYFSSEASNWKCCSLTLLWTVEYNNDGGWRFRSRGTISWVSLHLFHHHVIKMTSVRLRRLPLRFCLELFGRYVIVGGSFEHYYRISPCKGTRFSNRSDDWWLIFIQVRYLYTGRIFSSATHELRTITNKTCSFYISACKYYSTINWLYCWVSLVGSFLFSIMKFSPSHTHIKSSTMYN